MESAARGLPELQASGHPRVVARRQNPASAKAGADDPAVTGIAVPRSERDCDDDPASGYPRTGRGDPDPERPLVRCLPSTIGADLSLDSSAEHVPRGAVMPDG